MALPNIPQSRNEKYLAKIAGQEVELPNEPLSREEQYLDYIAKNGGGGGGYVLPTATELRLGGVKIGSGINVEEDGTISADIPTKVSELDNDEDFISDADYVHTDNNYDDTAKGIVNGVTEALAGKQDALTFDNVPTDGSNNPVKSGGVYASDEAIRQWTTAEAKSVSGNPIVITDGSARKAEGLSVECNPKQNLHGYDKPWAAGAGKNKLIAPTLAQLKSVNTTGTWNDNAYTIHGVTFTCNFGDDGLLTTVEESGTASAQALFIMPYHTGYNGSYILNGGVTTNKYIVLRKNNAWTQITSGSTSDSDVFTVEETDTLQFYIAVNSGQTGSGTFKPMIRLASVSDATFAPYSNICPITGYTECVVDRDGLNWWDEEWEIGTINPDTGATEANNGRIRSKNHIPVLGGVTYYFKCPSTSNCHIAYYNASKNRIGGSFGLTPNTTFTTPSNCAYLKFSPNNDYGTTYNNDICINVSDNNINGKYTPYIAHTSATITFGQTVYGGSVDFKMGKVTVDKVMKTFDDSSLTWSYQSMKGGFFECELEQSSNYTGNALQCEIYNYGGYNISNAAMQTAPDQSIFKRYDVGRGTNANKIRVKDSRYTDTTTWLAAVGNHKFTYELATPTELTLTPAELELLKGYNYITTNGTTISLDYLPDSLLAEVKNYVDNADSVLNAKIDEIDGRVDSIEAMSYHTESNGTKTVTLTNVYQQIFISISILDTRTIYLVVQQKATASVVETIFSTAGKTPIDIAVTHVSDNSFTITIPRFAQTNIISTEPFSVE